MLCDECTPKCENCNRPIKTLPTEIDTRHFQSKPPFVNVNLDKPQHIIRRVSSPKIVAVSVMNPTIFNPNPDGVFFNAGDDKSIKIHKRIEGSDVNIVPFSKSTFNVTKEGGHVEVDPSKGPQ